MGVKRIGGSGGQVMAIKASRVGGAWALMSALVALGLLTGCNEKSAAKSGSTPSPGGESGDSDDDGGDESDSDGTGSGTFDLCKDGLEEVSISGFSTYIKQLCSDGKLVALREDDKVYTGGDAKIFKDNVEKGDTETSIRFYTSSLVDAAVEDYWALMQLQLKKPEAYRKNFDSDESADLTEVEPDGESVQYRYSYDSGNGGGVNYVATTKFHVLKKGQAYMTSTTHDKMYETMKDIKALIIINKKSSSKTEVFTMSDQNYEHAENQADATETEAITKAEEEQKRMYKNAKDAENAPDLL